MNPASTSDRPHQEHNSGDASLFKWIFSRNPFYIVSAGLLLYAIYRLSVDPHIFATELGQLLFNFGSFQFYELLLVGTAIFLARRHIWYDSALLVSLESLFVFVPFILISQALLIESHVAAIFCLGATALAVLRFTGVKKYFERIHLPPRLLLLGSVLLLVNVGLPLLAKFLHEDTNSFVWDERGRVFYRTAWIIALPLLFALPNLMTRSSGQGDLLVQKSYFPLGILMVWAIVTGAHLYSVGYVYGLKWSGGFMAPILWVIAWTLRNRIGDFDSLDENTVKELRELLSIPAAAVPLIAAFTADWTTYLLLASLNAAFYGFLLFRERSAIAFHLLLVSGAMVLGGLPKSVFEALHLDVSRGQLLGAGIAGYLLVRAILSSNPKFGIVGAVVAAIVTGVIFGRTQHYFEVGVQMGFVFLLIHSLRWVDAEHAGAKIARQIASLLWVLHAAFWLARDGQTAVFATVAFALVAVVAYGAVRLIFGFWGARVVPLAAMLVLVCKPVLLVKSFFEMAPAGLVALVTSFVLFAIGTVVALMRNRGTKNERSLTETAQINTTL